MCSDLDNILSVSGDGDFYGVLMGWEQLAVMLPIGSIEDLQSPELQRVSGATILIQRLKLTSAYNAYSLADKSQHTQALRKHSYRCDSLRMGACCPWGSVNSLCHILKCFLLFICLLLFWNDWKYAMKKKRCIFFFFQENIKWKRVTFWSVLTSFLSFKPFPQYS